MLKESVLNVEVSSFKNYDTPQNPVSINLLTWLTSEKYKDKVESIRKIENKKERDAIKSKLPAITPSGIFSYRKESDLIRHSGLIQIDIDLTGKNKLISNWEDLKTELKKLPQIAYLGKSVSGRGYWGLIPIPDDANNHRFYFNALEEIFLKNWGIELDDKPKNVASLRGYSFDPEAYFNHYAKPYFIKKTLPPRLGQTVKRPGIESSRLGDWIIRKLEYSPMGRRHGDRLKFSFLAGGFVAGGYLDSNFENSLIESYLSQYSQIDSLKIQIKEIKAIKDGFRNGLNHPLDIKNLNVHKEEWLQEK
jgi:hypothetical protein